MKIPSLIGQISTSVTRLRACIHEEHLPASSFCFGTHCCSAHPPPAPKLLALSELNTASRADFFHSVNTLFETAPPLADALFAARPFASYEALIDAGQAIMAKLSPADRLEVINAHPRIGANPAQLSALSYREQGYDKEKAAETEKQAAVLAELSRLNEEYEKKFGFKFIVWVAGRPKEEIIPVIKTRMSNAREQELETGLTEMMRIAHDRLRKLKAEQI